MHFFVLSVVIEPIFYDMFCYGIAELIKKIAVVVERKVIEKTEPYQNSVINLRWSFLKKWLTALSHYLFSRKGPR